MATQESSPSRSSPDMSDSHWEHLGVAPALPSVIGHLELLGIPGRWDRIDGFGRRRVEVERR